jgi:dTDP-4-dehydrorhamnose reductase
MAEALIGYTGFVGGSIGQQHGFDDQYNSQNIEEARGQKYDLVVCAGAPGVVWKANQEPEADKQSIQRLMDCLKQVKMGQLVLISTVNVFITTNFDPVVGVDETTPIQVDALQPYGKHRFMLEEFARENFPTTIIRLPGLFGTGLKKNLIYDIIHKQRYETFHPHSLFQFYNMGHIWDDIQRSLQEKLPLMHLATEPVSVVDVGGTVGEAKLFTNEQAPRVHYDFGTKYAHLWGGNGQYIASKQEILAQIEAFIRQEREALP